MLLTIKILDPIFKAGRLAADIKLAPAVLKATTSGFYILKSNRSQCPNSAWFAMLQSAANPDMTSGRLHLTRMPREFIITVKQRPIRIIRRPTVMIPNITHNRLSFGREMDVSRSFRPGRVAFNLF